MVDRSIAGVAAFPNGRTRTVAWANRARIVQGRVNTETGGEMEGEVRFAGIDVSKAQLDVAVRPTGKRWVLPYDETGIEGLIPQIVDLEPALVLLEATGGLELPLVAALAAAALPVVVVNPRQVRDFAKATGTLAKTDTLDAGVLAHFADAVRPPVASGSTCAPQGRRDPGPQLADCPQAPGDDHAGLREEPAGYRQRRR